MKKKFMSQQRAYTPKFVPKVGLSTKFKINFSPWSIHIFAILTSKINSLTRKTPWQQFSGITLFQKLNYSSTFKTWEQNLPLVAENLNCDNLKITLVLKFFFLFCVILFKFKNKYPCLVTHNDSHFKLSMEWPICNVVVCSIYRLERDYFSGNFYLLFY